ncbi:putative ribonuclease H-like domain-containing protein [Tanacetum coccineum]
MRGILRQYSVARTPQQNRVAERRNRMLIEAVRTMLADFKLPTTFWAEAVSTACYVQNKVLVVEPHNKTPYELFHGRTPALSFMRPFGCPVTILNTIDHLGKFDGKDNEGFFVGYSLNSKAFRVFNSRTRIVEENLHIRKEQEPGKDYILLPLWTAEPPFSQDLKSSQEDGFKPSNYDGKKVNEDPRKEDECKDQEKDDSVNSTNKVNTVSSAVNVASSNEVNVVSRASSIEILDDPNMPELVDISIFEDATDDEDVGAEADIKNLESTFQVSLITTTRVHKDHPLDQVIGDLQSATQTRRMSKNLEEHSGTQKGNSSIERSKLDRGYAGRASTIQATRRFKDLDFPDKVYKVKKALYGLHQAPRAWYETLSTYLLDNGFQRGKIDKTLFIRRHKGDILLVQVYVDDIIFGSTKKELCIEFEKLMHDKFKMSSIGELTFLLGLQVKQKKDGIFISQDKYVAKILKKFRFTEVKTASTPMETQKPLLKDEYGEEVDVHMYRSMIGSLEYLTSSRPDIMFTVCACSRYQVTPKVSHLHVVKRIFRYLKGQPKLGLWYPKDSPFDLAAYTDSDYAG